MLNRPNPSILGIVYSGPSNALLANRSGLPHTRKWTNPAGIGRTRGTGVPKREEAGLRPPCPPQLRYTAVSVRGAGPSPSTDDPG